MQPIGWFQPVDQNNICSFSMLDCNDDIAMSLLTFCMTPKSWCYAGKLEWKVDRMSWSFPRCRSVARKLYET
jgi:hypothetical protein